MSASPQFPPPLPLDVCAGGQAMVGVSDVDDLAMRGPAVALALELLLSPLVPGPAEAQLTVAVLPLTGLHCQSGSSAASRPMADFPFATDSETELLQHWLPAVLPTEGPDLARRRRPKRGSSKQAD